MPDFLPPFFRLSGLGPFLLTAGLLSACSSPAPYQPPEVAVPTQFSQAALFRQANPAAADVPDSWWTVFRDPVLDELQTRLLAGNLNLQAAAAAVDAAQAALASSRAGVLPTVGLNAGATRSASPGSSAATVYTTQGVLATWEVDLWGRVRSGVNAADARYQASRATLAGTRLSLQATLVQTYFSLRSSQALQGILTRSVDSYAQSLALVQNRYQGGVASQADVVQARAQWLSTQAQLEEARLQGTQLRHALALLLGQAPGAFDVAANPLPTVLPAVPDQLPAQLLERRPDIAAAERQVAAANAQVGAAEAAFFPALTLSASAGVRGSELAGLFQSPHQLWSLGTAVAVSLFDGGARTAAKASAQASYQQTVATYRQTVLAALQEVEDNLAAATQLGRSVALQAQALVAAQQALVVLQNQYKAGTVAYLNVLTAQNTVLSAERNLLDARNRQLAAVNQLLKNVAGRWG